MVTKQTALVIITITIVAVAFIVHTYSIVSNVVTLNSAGASFPYPLIDKMITEYNRVKPHVYINYQPSGSGAGITALIDKTVVFAGSDAPLSTAEREKAQDTLHIPVTIGSIAIAYNIPNVSSGLKLTGQIIADIFEGKITMWNDPAITNLNSDIILPATKISTVHRSDSSGTTFVFTGYLSEVSSSWLNSVGQSKTVAWPFANDVASSGNLGVAQIVNSTSYSIGYVELVYALQTGMTVAAVQNTYDSYVLPTLESTTVAAQAVALDGLPAGNANWANVNMFNAKDPQAYPIVSFSYLLVYKELSIIPNMTQERATELVHFLLYIVTDGQNLAHSSNYASLPANVVAINIETIQLITFNEQTIPVVQEWKK
jgi:phosphate transport system permease protein/phosphate transport system substrate-binding protein